MTSFQVQRYQVVSEDGATTQRHIRIKIPKEKAKIVSAEQMKMLQLEAAAKLYH